MPNAEEQFTVEIKKVSEVLLNLNKILESETELDENDITDKFICAFDLLFQTPENPNNLFSLIQQSGNKEQTREYLAKISQLKNLVDKLSETFKYKNLLLNKINDNCNLHWINKFNNKEYQLDDAGQFITESSNENIYNTVVVKTWGTQSEISSGLKNVIQQKLRGDDVGHVSLTMRVKADEEGLRLVQKYCLGPDGSVKIPYNLKKYGNQAVYEIYWSYWPGRLNTIKKDIEIERGFEYQLDKQLVAEMPEELARTTLLQKFRKEKPIVLAPAAIENLHTLENDNDRRNYLALKKQKYEVNEKAASLKVLLSNYLEKDNEKNKKIESENFSVLLRRFKHQFPLKIQLIISEGLRKKEFTIAENKLLLDATKKLLDATIEKGTLLKAQIREVGNKIQLANKDIKELKVAIEKSRAKLIETQEIIEKFSNSTSELAKEIASVADNTSFSITVETMLLVQEYTSRSPKLQTFYIDPNDRKVTKEQAIIIHEIFSKGLENRKVVMAETQQKFQKNMLRLQEITLNPRGVITADLLQKQSEVREIERELEKITEQVLKGTDKISPEMKAHKQELLEKVALLLSEITEILDKYADRALNIENKIFQLENELHDSEANIQKIDAFISGFSEDSKKVKHEITFTEIDSITQEKKLITQQYSTPAEAQAIKERIEKYQNYLKHTKQTLEKEKNILTRLESTRSTEDLIEKGMYRGFPRNEAVLRQFDIESMLKEASTLASTVDKFSLQKENCSTTSLKLLSAGSPPEMSVLFQWSKAGENEKIPSNTFISNPQGVYSKSRVAEDFEKGLPSAKHYVEQAQQPLSQKERDYIFLLNTLAMAGSKKIAEATKSFFNQVKLLFLFIPYICNLWRDYNPPKDEKGTPKTDTYFEKLTKAVKNPETGTYDLISAWNAPSALVLMQKTLESNKQLIPFFDKSTLESVDKYILSLQTQKNLNPEEKNHLENYQKIIDERNARLDCVKQAITSGKNPEAELNTRKVELNYVVTKEAQAEKIVSQFIEKYKNLRDQSFNPFKTNFVANLPKDASFEEKLKIIHQHILENPKSRSANAWRESVISQESLESLELASPLENVYKDYKKNYQETVKDDTDDSLGMHKPTV